WSQRGEIPTGTCAAYEAFMRWSLVASMCGLLGCSGGSANVASSDGGGQESADGSPPAIGNDGGGDAATNIAEGAKDIYKTCPASSAYSQTYSGPGFAMRYPSTWSGNANASNSYALSTPYEYLPTGSTTPKATSAQVTTFTGNTATNAADVQRMLNDMVGG